MNAKFKTAIPILICTLFSPSTLLAQSDSTYWWNDRVFYEIFVRSFYDSNGDGIGDLQGLTQKLDYLNDGNPNTTTDLGITGIWLMPMNPSPSYHGYDVTDYRGIEPDYGTLEDFQTFLAAAHARGIRVIMDFVINHSSSQHPWFVQSSSGAQSPYRNWYTWVTQHPGYGGPWGQQVWHFLNGNYYFGLFWSGMPDLNLATPALKAEIFSASAFWLDTMNVDGFRLDAIKHLFENGEDMEHNPLTFAFLQQYRQAYKSARPDAMTVGEVWSSTSQVAPYVDGTKVDYCFEFDLSYSIVNAVNAGNPADISNKMQEVLTSYPYLQYAPFLTNHDQNRAFEQFGSDQTKMKLAAAVLLTLPGVPFMYYGEEVGMIGSGADENKRKPMQWNSGANAGFTSGSPWYPLNSNYASYNVAGMQPDQNSMWQWYRKLIGIRNNERALRKGDYAALNTGTPNMLAFARRTANEVVLVLHNFQNQSVNNPSISLQSSGLIPGLYDVTDLTNATTAGSVTLNALGGFSSWSAQVTVPAKGTIILKIAETTTEQSLNAGWNLVSVPLDVQNSGTSFLYPGAISPAYGFNSTNGYFENDTLEMGAGYWVKFPSAQNVSISGRPVVADTIDVSVGWNLIGSISSTIATNTIGSIPGGIVTSAFYRYGGSGYSVADTLTPGEGSWVKTTQNGKLILAEGNVPATSQRIVIVPKDELPPAPPQEK